MNTIEYGQGAVNNTIGWGQGAKVGSSFSNTKSIELDGVDDYVISSIDGTSSGGVLASADSDVVTTLSFWFKVPSFPSSQKGIFQWANAFNDGTPFLLLNVIASGNIKFYVDGNFRLTQSISTGVWYNFVTTRTASNNTWTFYLNGSSVGTYDDGGTITNRASASSIYLGNGYNGYFNGLIDEFALWNVELSASDVTSIYNSGVPNDISSLSPLTWWRCGDGDTSPTLTDKGSGGNNGTMNNFSTFSTDVPT